MAKPKKTKKTTRFTKPTLSDVKEYASSIRFELDCEAFMNFYDSKGWKVGKSPMKDWQAAVRTWKKGTDASSKDCHDCHAPYKDGFKYYTVVRGKKRYRCPECEEKAKQGAGTSQNETILP